MASMPWVKLYTEMLSDHKLRMLKDGAKWRFVQFLLLAGEFDLEGFIPMSLDDIAWRLHIDEDILLSDIDAMIKDGLIEHSNEGYNVINFSKRQGRSQSEKREQWRERQQRHRDKVNDVTGDKENVTSMSQNEGKVSHAPRGEESRGDKEEEEKDYLASALELWGELFPGKPQPRAKTKSLQDKWKTRIKDRHFVKNYEQALHRASYSSYLANADWFNFRWIIKNDDNYQKVLDGTYDQDYNNKNKPAKSTKQALKEQDYNVRS